MDGAGAPAALVWREALKLLPLLAYVGGAYRDPRGAYYVAENIRAASEVALACWRAGLPALCPHKNSALYDGALPDEVWLAGDLLMLARCDVLVLVPGWERSAGTRAEVEFARERGIPVIEYGEGTLTGWCRLMRDRLGMEQLT